ncbi:MAG: CopG family transcriptional regulator [Candidatus Zixiibacteriota bacterium]
MKRKTEIITFKADEALLQAMKGIENRSKFIREAVFAALDNACPLCKGTGALSVNQKRHWDSFAKEHLLRECRECHEVHLVCAKKTKHTSRKMRSSYCRRP